MSVTSSNPVRSRRTPTPGGPAVPNAKPRSAGATTPADYPYVMPLPDGRRVLVEVPGKWVTADRDGAPAFRPAAMEYLDRVLVLLMSTDTRPPTPGYLVTLRKALRMTQAQFGVAIGRDKITVSRWERGETTPSKEALQAIDRVRREATRKGVVLPS